MKEFGAYLADRWADDLPSVAHAHFWMSGLAALRGAGPHQVPVVQTFHALGSVTRRYQGSADTSPPERVRLEGEIGRAVDRIVATCRDEVRELGLLDVPAGKVTVAPCGVDSTLFTPHGPIARRAGRRRLLIVSRLVERKGIADAIRALPLIPDTELLVAGGAGRAGTRRFEADPEVVEMRAVAERHGVADRVRLLGQVAQPDLPPLYRSADLVVCTPWYEPFGIVPLEAMACGVPVVAGAVGGLLDTVRDGVTGRHVPTRDPEALAGAVCELLADPVRRREMSAAGTRRARERYSWRQVAITTELAYRQVVPERRATGAATRGAAR
jgi:glycosyltransferase involved in cell wall biosynthesis